MKLIVGLGNPGPEYQATRHNVGFWVVDRLAERRSLRWFRKGEAELAAGRIAGQEVLLAKPQGFMNRSGRVVAALLQSYGLGPADLVVIHDDLDLEVGRIRIREKGSAGGHRGVASILQSVGDEDFVRVRLGIGRDERIDPVDYVLRPFSKADRERMVRVIDHAAEAVERLMAGELSRVMNEFNRVVD